MSGLNIGGAPKLGTGVATQATVKPTESQAEADKTTQTPKTDSEVTDAAKAQSVALSAEPAARWTSHPIQRYSVGDYHFANGLLVLATEEDAAEFQAVYDSLPIFEQTRLRKVDLSAAEAIVRERLKNAGGATQGIDSSTGDRAPNKQVGDGDLIKG
jgi:hypothetical protein